MRYQKTRKLTPGGRLVTRAQLQFALQKAADQIGDAVLGGLKKLEEAHGARLKVIEERLGIGTPKLVEDILEEWPLGLTGVMTARHDFVGTLAELKAENDAAGIPHKDAPKEPA